MKANKIQDERVLLERRALQSKGYAWLVTLLLVSIVVQQFLMQAPFAQYAVEFFLLIGCGVYNVIGNYKRGIDVWNPAGEGKKKILLNTLVAGGVSVVLFAFLSGEMDAKGLVFYFVTFVVCFYIVRLVMIDLNGKKQRKIESQLDEDEMRK